MGRDMSNAFIKLKPGYYHPLEGEFSWWPVSVTRGKPWPKEVPILGPDNFPLVSCDSSDRRTLDQWVEGFPHDKWYRVEEALRQAIKEVTGQGIGGGYKYWIWGAKNDGAPNARVWNHAMALLGYDTELEAPAKSRD